MDSDNFSFVNGIIVGAGIALAVMSIAFMKMVEPLEGVYGFSSMDIRVGIFLGILVSVAAMGYEIYRKKETKDTTKIDQTEEQETEKKQIKDSESEKKNKNQSAKIDE